MRRPRLSYANVVASLALFVSLGGGAYAVTRLPAGSVGTRQLRNHAVTAKKVARNSLTGLQIKESTLGEVHRSKRSDFAAVAGFANDAGNAASATSAITAATATTATRATTALTATKATTATQATNATNATNATTATNAANAAHAKSADTSASATNALQLGGRAASAYLGSDHILGASVDPVAAAGKRLFSDTGTGAVVLDAGRGIVQITNSAKVGYLVLSGLTTTAGGAVTGRSTTIAPGASTEPSGSSPAAFLDLMITHVGPTSSASTRLRLTCSLGTDPGTNVAALSCIGLQ